MFLFLLSRNKQLAEGGVRRGGGGGCITIRRPSNDRAAFFYYFGWLASAGGAHNGCSTATPPEPAFIKRRKFTTACCARRACYLHCLLVLIKILCEGGSECVFARSLSLCASACACCWRRGMKLRMIRKVWPAQIAGAAKLRRRRLSARRRPLRSPRVQIDVMALNNFALRPINWRVFWPDEHRTVPMYGTKWLFQTFNGTLICALVQESLSLFKL